MHAAWGQWPWKGRALYVSVTARVSHKTNKAKELPTLCCQVPGGLAKPQGRAVQRMGFFAKLHFPSQDYIQGSKQVGGVRD